MKRLWMVKVEACVYVLAASRRDAERIACDGVEKNWLDGTAYDGDAVTPEQIDRDWRNVLPLVKFGEEEPEETCLQIAEREAEDRRVAEWKAKHELTLPGVKL